MLYLPRALHEEMLAHCRRESPKEACGILAGSNGRVSRVFTMTNADASPISYAFDPKEHLRVNNTMEHDKLELLAIYHSHTATRAYPSPVDVARASEPGVALLMPDVRYVLVSLKDPRHPDVKNYAIRDGSVADDGLEVA